MFRCSSCSLEKRGADASSLCRKTATVCSVFTVFTNIPVDLMTQSDVDCKSKCVCCTALRLDEPVCALFIIYWDLLSPSLPPSLSLASLLILEFQKNGFYGNFSGLLMMSSSWIQGEKNKALRIDIWWRRYVSVILWLLVLCVGQKWRKKYAESDFWFVSISNLNSSLCRSSCYSSWIRNLLCVCYFAGARSRLRAPLMFTTRFYFLLFNFFFLSY